MCCEEIELAAFAGCKELVVPRKWVAPGAVVVAG